MEKQNLSRWQQGFLQKSLLFTIYVISTATIVISFSILSKFLYKRILTFALQDEIITEEIFINLLEQVEKFDAGLLIFLTITTSIALVIFLMRWIANSNWAFSTTLPEAIEFRQAMSNLGIKTPKNEIEFVQKYKLNVFIAHNSLTNFEEKSVKARLYYFAQDKVFSSQKTIESYIGAKKLCILKEDYSNLLEESEKALSLRESSLVVEKDKEITALTSSIASLKLELEKNQKELEELKMEHIALKNSQKPVVGQEVARVNRLRQEMLQWAVVLPTLEMLIEEAPVDKIYVERELTDRFNSEWNKREDLQEQMQTLTKSKELKLSEAFMKSIKSYLAEKNLYSHKGGGQFKYPKKSI